MSTPQEAQPLDCNTCLSPGSFMNQRFAGVQLLRFVAAMLVAVIGGLILMFGIDWNASTDRLISWGAAAALLVMGAVRLEPWTAATRPARALSFLGDSSYSIYLSHTFVVPAGVMALHKLVFRRVRSSFRPSCWSWFFQAVFPTSGLNGP